jgi:membrane protein
MQKKSLEITCYVAGAGAFGVFLRWLQDQLAFDENGLSEPSVFNFLVPLMLLAAAWMFTRFINKIQDDKCYVPRDFCDALFNPGKLFAVARWAIGLLMCLGSVVLLMTSETDVDADFIRIICLLGFLSGLAFPFVLGSANYDEFANVRFVRLCMMMPILLFSAWLILCYKQNSYNSVVWSYVIEMATIIVALLAFFRIAGYAFFAPNWRKCMLAIMMGAAMCIMSLADERYMGMHIIMLSAALMLILYNWILFKNLRKKVKRSEIQEPQSDEGGFEQIK